jgi:hypothetical protein
MANTQGEHRLGPRTGITPHFGEELLELARAWMHRQHQWEPHTVDLSALWTLARRHGAEGMAGGLVAAGASVAEPFGGLAFQAYCSNTLRFRQTKPICQAICDAAHSAGIALAFVKGPALAAAYGDEGVRGFGDLDVLVPDGAAGRKLAELCKFRIVHGLVDVPSQVCRRAKGIGRVEAKAGEFGVELTYGSLRANQPLHDFYQYWPERYLLRPGAGGSLPVPDPEAHLLFLLQHLAQHWCSRLIWLVDFAVLMRSGPFDSAWLEHAASRLEMRKLLRAVTVFCRRHLDETTPELGFGPTGWKDGLYLCVLDPEALMGSALHKYGHGCAAPVKDALLGAFQHVFATDIERPLATRCRAASRWMGEWLQHVLFPGGSATAKLGPWVTPIMLLAMLALVCILFKQLPRGFARLAKRSLCTGSAAREPSSPERLKVC